MTQPGAIHVLASQLFRAALLALFLPVANPVQASGVAVSGSSSINFIATPPSDFSDLAGPRESLVDLYYGGRRIGEARIVARPGFVRFRDPAGVVAAIPNLDAPAAVLETLGLELPNNAALACSDLNTTVCGTLSPNVVGIIHNEERFRIDLFVNPSFLRAVAPLDSDYLATPDSRLSMTNSMGLTMSGSTSTSPTYNLQSRTIVGFRNGRLRSNSSYASHYGLVVDDFVAEIDRPNLRYSAGMFWAPGLDLIGQRRILGVGIGTQLDTRADKDVLQGTPLLLFLEQPARVEILSEGRLLASRVYEAGNNLLDTASLPDGSHSLVLRIRPPGGAVREERRFFVKNAQIAPLGRPIYFAYAGLLANIRPNRPVSASNTLFYQAGAAVRVSHGLALDLTAIGTQHKAMVEAGGFLITRGVRFRAAALASTDADFGGLVQFGTVGNRRLAVNFDLRRIWSSNGKPLLPLPDLSDSFASTIPTGAQIGGGSYLQASGTLGYRIGQAYVALAGSLRNDIGHKSSYSYGPSFTWPIVLRQSIQLTLQADAQRTRGTIAGFVGMRMMVASNGLSLLSTFGRAAVHSRDGSQQSSNRTVGSLSGQWYHDTDDRTQIALGGGLDRALEATTANANGTVYSRFGSVRGDVLHSFGGGRASTQYGFTVQSGMAATADNFGLGGRDLDQSAVIVAVKGETTDSTFEVFVDDVPRGQLRGGATLPIFLQPYRSYQVRLRPVESQPVSFDLAARKVTLYPGNVASLTWRVASLLTVFGQATLANGRPLANVTVQSRRGAGQTDGDGYFQVDVGTGDSLSFSLAQGGTCTVPVKAVRPRKAYVNLGKVACE